MKYNPRFDGLRCIAIAAVMLYHFAPSLGRVVSSGFYGVNLFFVLSGFLITSILLQPAVSPTGRQYLNFLGRRALRIFPIYYLALLLVFLTDTPNIHARIVYLLTYTYNFIMPFVDWSRDYTVNFWSLSVEEQFYIFFPIFILLLRDHWKILLAICTACILLAWLQVFFNIYRVSGTERQLYVFNYVSLFTNMAPLSLGVMAAVLNARDKVPQFFYSFTMEFIALALTLYTLIFLPFGYNLVFCSLFNAVFILKAWKRSFSIRALEWLTVNKFAQYVGRISYGLYVYHFIVRSFMDEWIIRPLWANPGFGNGSVFTWFVQHPGLFRLVACTGVTLCIAHLSFKFIERPLLRLKDKLFSYKLREGDAPPVLFAGANDQLEALPKLSK